MKIRWIIHSYVLSSCRTVALLSKKKFVRVPQSNFQRPKSYSSAATFFSNDWLGVWLNSSRIFHSYGDVNNWCQWRTANYQACCDMSPLLKVFELGDLYCATPVLTLNLVVLGVLWFFEAVLPERPPNVAPSSERQGILGTYCNRGLHRKGRK